MKNKISAIIKPSLKSETGFYSARVISAAVICGDVEYIETFSNDNSLKYSSGGDNAPVFYIYSLTKTIISALILKLAENGALSVEDRLDKWFPLIKNSGSISILNTLMHTGGLGDYGGLTDYHNAVKKGMAPWSFDEFINRTIGGKLLFTPGSKFSYSNIGYMLLKKIIEIEYGRSFFDALQSFICVPLNLKYTKVSSTVESLKDNLFGLSCYLGTKESPVDVCKIYHPQWVSHGVISSNAYEIAVIYKSLFNGCLMSEAQLELMVKGIKVEGVTGRPFYEPYYGAGLMIDIGSPYGPVYGHTGGGPGASAACYHLVRKNGPVTAAILTDGEDPVQAERIIYEIFKVFA